VCGRVSTQWGLFKYGTVSVFGDIATTLIISGLARLRYALLGSGLGRRLFITCRWA
jgi:hypothetical protein